MIQTTPWARRLVGPASLAVIHRESVEREAHVSLTARSPRGPLQAVVYQTGAGQTIEWLRTQGPVEHVVRRIHEVLAIPPELASCHECGEETEPGYDICPACCGHKDVETRDEADGSDGLAHRWRSTCENCGSEVTGTDVEGEWETVQ